MAWNSKTWPTLRRLLAQGFGPQNVGIAQAELAELALRAAMAERRRAVRKAAGAYGGNRHIRVSAQRFARDRGRQLKKLFLTRRHWAVPKHLLFSKRIPSPILDRLDVERSRNWRPVVARKFKRDLTRIRLETLNFIDDPVGTLADLRKLAAAERSEVCAYLDFSDTHCVDVGAYLVLAEIWPQLGVILHGGQMSLAVQKVLSAIRLDQELSIGLVGVRDHKDVWAFPIRRRRPRGTTTSETANLKPQEREKVADQLCDLFNNWLDVASGENGQVEDWELSPEGKALIAQMTGELLDNAERHSFPSSADGDWSTTAFMAARSKPDGSRELRCHLAFLSVGQSISEAMGRAPDDIQDAANNYVSRFKRAPQSRDTLLTVLALQDAITSDPEARKNHRGGTGLQDVLELIGDLGAAEHPESDVRVTIVSGASCIRLRHPNLIGSRDGNGRRVQWCNDQNDPRYPPKVDIAFDLPWHFAGTLVSVGFTLDSRLFMPEASESDDIGN